MRFQGLASLLLLAGACASGAPLNNNKDSGGVVVDAGADLGPCPQYDLQTDPKHCGSCTNACVTPQTCAAGKCVLGCTPPQLVCPGSGCVDTSLDPVNCGACGVVCSATPDGGGPPGGSGNPDSGLPPGDGGVSVGWLVGSSFCSGSTCNISCGGGMALCADNLCWDTQFAHPHCGSCAIACAASQHCNRGKCCALGEANCGGTCTPVLADPSNCGACGNVCPPGKAMCVAGVCTGPPPVTFSASFPGTPATLCTQWQTFIAQLGSGYSQVTLSGSQDPGGITCASPAVADGLAAALKGVSSYVSVSCGGHVWSTCNRYNDELWIDPPSLCDTQNCPNPGRILRPCFSSAGFSALLGNTCGAPAQTITLTFQ